MFQIHIGDRRYKCHICGQTSLRQSNINKHIRGVHNGQHRVLKNKTKATRRVTKSTREVTKTTRGVTKTTQRVTETTQGVTEGSLGQRKGSLRQRKGSLRQRKGWDTEGLGVEVEHEVVIGMNNISDMEDVFQTDLGDISLNSV